MQAAIDAEARSEDRKSILHNEHRIQDLEAKVLSAGVVSCS